MKGTLQALRRIVSAVAWDVLAAAAELDRIKQREKRLEELAIAWQSSYPAGVKSVLFWARQLASVKGPLPVEVDEAIKQLGAAIVAYDAECRAARNEAFVESGWGVVLRDTNGEEVRP